MRWQLARQHMVGAKTIGNMIIGQSVSQSVSRCRNGKTSIAAWRPAATQLGQRYHWQPNNIIIDQLQRSSSSSSSSSRLEAAMLSSNTVTYQEAWAGLHVRLCARSL